MNEQESQTTFVGLYHDLLSKLREERDFAGRSEKTRWLSIAITDLESSLLRYEGAQEKGE